MATEINVSNICQRVTIALGGCSALGTQAVGEFQTVEEENGCEHTRMHTRTRMHTQNV